MAPSPSPSPPLAARPAWTHSFGGSDRHTGRTMVKQVGAGSSSVLRPSSPTLDVFLLRRNLEAGSCLSFFPLKHQVSCSQEERKGPLFCMKGSKCPPCPPLPFPCLPLGPFSIRSWVVAGSQVVAPASWPYCGHRCPSQEYWAAVQGLVSGKAERETPFLVGLSAP